MSSKLTQFDTTFYLEEQERKKQRPSVGLFEDDQEISESEFQKLLADSIKKVSNSQNSLIESVSRRIENINSSSNLSKEKCNAIFEQGGFKRKIAEIKGKIFYLAQRTINKIKKLVPGQPAVIHFSEMAELNTQKAQNAEIESIEIQSAEQPKKGGDSLDIRSEVESLKIMEDVAPNSRSIENKQESGPKTEEEIPEAKIENGGQKLQRIRKAMERLAEKQEILKGIELFPKEGLLADGEHIENQQIDIIRDSEGNFHIIFKLKEEYYDLIRDRYKLNFGAPQSTITYKTSEGELDLADCWQREFNGFTLKVSSGSKISSMSMESEEIRSSLGLVEIIIHNGNQGELKLEEIIEKINEILVQELDIAEGFSLPTLEQEKKI
jgi:hypothetical protein